MTNKIWKSQFYEERFLRNRWYLRDARLLDITRVYEGPAFWLIVVKGKEHFHHCLVVYIKEADVIETKSQKLKELPMFLCIGTDLKFMVVVLSYEKFD